MGEARKVAGLTNEQSKEQNGRYRGSIKRDLSSQKCGVGTEVPQSTEIGLCSEMTLCKTIQTPMQYAQSKIRLHHK